MNNQFGDEIGNDPLGIAIIVVLVFAFVAVMFVTGWWSRRPSGNRRRKSDR